MSGRSWLPSGSFGGGHETLRDHHGSEPGDRVWWQPRPRAARRWALDDLTRNLAGAAARCVPGVVVDDDPPQG